MRYQRTIRSAFTAIEVLIVVAIIALLMSIAAGAIIRVKAASEKTATETTLTKLASMLDRHWKAVIDSAKKEYDALPLQIKQNLVALADNVTATPTTPKPHPRRDDRARLLYVKFRLKQEFPASFEEAVDPDPTFGTFLPATGNAPAIPNRPNTNKTTGKPTYVKFVEDFYNKANSPSNQNISWQNRKLYPTPKYQSAILLALALEQGRSGLTPANLEQEVGASFILTGFEDVEAKKATQPKNIVLPRHLVDTWGAPLQLYIFPAYQQGENPGTTDLEIATTFSTKGSQPNQGLRERLQSSGGPDAQDPEGLLLDQSISQWDSKFMMAYLHPQLRPQLISNAGGSTTFAMRKMVPTIVSAGPDSLIGDVPMPMGGTETGWSATNPWMRLIGNNSFDNLYSFRLRQTGARGE